MNGNNSLSQIASSDASNADPQSKEHPVELIDELILVLVLTLGLEYAKEMQYIVPFYDSLSPSLSLSLSIAISWSLGFGYMYLFFEKEHILAWHGVVVHFVSQNPGH